MLFADEMCVLIRREDDGDLYKDAYEEAQRIIRISDEVRIMFERVASAESGEAQSKANANAEAEASSNSASKFWC